MEEGEIGQIQGKSNYICWPRSVTILRELPHWTGKIYIVITIMHATVSIQFWMTWLYHKNHNFIIPENFVKRLPLLCLSLWVFNFKWHGIIDIIMNRADSRLAPSQWETSLQSNAIPHWLGTNLESALINITNLTSLKNLSRGLIHLSFGIQWWNHSTYFFPFANGFTKVYFP